MIDLNKKSVVITGGGRGIGRALALACKKAGALVSVAARSKTDLDETSAELKAVNDLPYLTVSCDVTKTEDLKNLYQQSEKKFGSLHGLICAAGIYGAIGPFITNDFEEWAQAIDINLTGTARSIHTAFSYLRQNSRIILFSGGGQAAMPNFSSYVTGKGGIWRMTETLGAEFAEKEIYLNAIAPGAVNTKLLEDILKAGPEKTGASFYQKSLQQKETGGQGTEKACELALYLLSDRSKGLYGKTLSAIWDSYLEFENLEMMSKSDIFTAKRVVDFEGNTRAMKK
jgi:NAD(P)-dependent dehydrogenase (short-subunit alcohol dehydrogenase family)